MAAAEFNYKIPPFSATASQIMAELTRPDVKVPQIIQLIECEPTIGSQVLRMANSPIYGCRREIARVGHAIVILGFKTVAQAAIAAATGSIFNDSSDECDAARRQTYRESLSVATTGRLIAQRLRLANPDEAFLSGVMHDIGKLIFFQEAGETYSNLLGNKPDGETADWEMQHFGIAHPGLGKVCGQKWGLPYSINKAIETHHESVGDLETPLSEVVVMANYLARRWQIGFEPEAMVAPNEAIEVRLACMNGESCQSECQDQFAAVEEICLAQAS